MADDMATCHDHLFAQVDVRGGFPAVGEERRMIFRARVDMSCRRCARVMIYGTRCSVSRPQTGALLVRARRRGWLEQAARG